MTALRSLPVGALRLDHDLHPGDDQRPTVVLLHGLTGSRTGYRPVVDHLIAAGWPVLAADLRGHGRSPRGGSYRAIDHGADVAALVSDRLSGPAVVVGHSLGGLVAHALAQHRPDLVAGLLLEDPPLYEADEARRAASPAAAVFPALIRFLTRVRDDGLGEAEVAAALGVGRTPYGTTFLERVGPRAVADRARELLRCDVATVQSAVDGEPWLGYDPAMAVDVPITAVRADPEVGAVLTGADADALLAASPRVTVELVSGIGHDIHGDPVGLRHYLPILDRFLADFS